MHMHPTVERLFVRTEELTAAVDGQRSLRTVQKQGRLIRSVGFGCHACKLPKLFTQMTVAVEPTQEGNFHNRSVCLFQQLLRPFYPLLDQVLVGSRADRLLKQMAEMKLADAHQRR